MCRTVRIDSPLCIRSNASFTLQTHSVSDELLGMTSTRHVTINLFREAGDANTTESKGHAIHDQSLVGMDGLQSLDHLHPQHRNDYWFAPNLCGSTQVLDASRLRCRHSKKLLQHRRLASSRDNVLVGLSNFSWVDAVRSRAKLFLLARVILVDINTDDLAVSTSRTASNDCRRPLPPKAEYSNVIAFFNFSSVQYRAHTCLTYTTT